MKPLFHPRLVNEPFGDPGLHVDLQFERRALLFDLGDLSPLAARALLKVSHAFVSHAHMDHFVGFDALVRLLLGRDRTLEVFGPAGFLDRIEHKLAAYTWNLVEGYESDFVIVATAVAADGTAVTADGTTERARFRTRAGFRREPLPPPELPPGVLLDEPGLTVRAAVLDHGIPCLAFALEEKLHVNVWKSGLEEMGLPTGPWLQEVKAAVARGDPDETPIPARWRDAGGELRERLVPLGELKARAMRVVPGQKVAYVTDAAYEPNAERIVELARGADLLFIEAAFLDAEWQRAAEKRHLTARQAGLLARAAGVGRMIPFHFSPKHTGRGEELEREAQEAFARG